MGRRGPPKTPTVLSILRGNPGKRAINHAEPKPAKAKKSARQPASWLAPDGKREWRRVVPELDRLGLLTKVDGASLEGYCAAYARAMEAERHVKKSGLTVMTEKGFVLQNPAVSIARTSWQQVRQFASEFGLTPAARTRIRTDGKPPAKDPDEEFLFNKKPGAKTA